MNIEDENKDIRLIGRKLYVKWGERMYIAIEKIPDGFGKIAELTASGSDYQLCNVYENGRGDKTEENLGAPAFDREGLDIHEIFTMPGFWMTKGEESERNVKHEDSE